MKNTLKSAFRPTLRRRARTMAWVQQRARQAREWTELHEAGGDDELEDLIEEEEIASRLETEETLHPKP